MNVSFGGGGIFFKDINNGIIGNYKTTNAGGSWIYMGNNTSGSSLSFPIQNTGYGTSASDIYKTTNFGDNWVSQINPSNQILNSINFHNVNTGYACGESGKIIKTTNGGTNWFIINTPFTINYILYTVFFIDSVRGYISGYNYPNDTNIFMRTTNGGNNWTTQYYTVSNWGKFASMFFVNANTGIIGASPYILKTTDAGAVWNQIIIPTSNRIYSLYFPSTSTGYGACHGGQILKTTNGGNNWFLQTTGTGSELYSIFFINNLTGYCSGYNNTVLKTTDGGGPPIGITPISSEVPKDFSLGQNYPNPFNPNTTINYSLKYDTWVTIKIYNLLGQVVKTLIDNFEDAGYRNVIWDGTNNYGNSVSSGVYFYKLIASDFIDQKKMVIIR